MANPVANAMEFHAAIPVEMCMELDGVSGFHGTPWKSVGRMNMLFLEVSGALLLFAVLVIITVLFGFVWNEW